MAFCTKCGGANDTGALFCKACGAALGSTATTPGTPPPPPVAGVVPPPVAPIIIVKKGSAGKILLILFAVFVGLILMGMVIASLAGADLNAKKESDPCDDGSFNYLYGLQHGTSSAVYWKPGVTAKNLIDVHSFNPLGHGTFPNSNGKAHKVPRVFYTYEVESSNAGGMPIRKHWAVVMEPNSKNGLDEPCAIVDVVETQ